jgi:hypothetical protein
MYKKFNYYTVGSDYFFTPFTEPKIIGPHAICSIHNEDMRVVLLESKMNLEQSKIDFSIKLLEAELMLKNFIKFV